MSEPKEQSENMYSYRDNSKSDKEGNAIRRSMGEKNPNKDTFNCDFENAYWIPFLILAIIESLIILALALLFEREFDLDKSDKLNNSTYIDDNGVNYYNYNEDEIKFNYGKLRDLNIMAFMGFALIHCILLQNIWTSISMNTLIIALSVQIALFFNFVWKMAFKEIWEEERMNFYFINKAIFIRKIVVYSTYNYGHV